MSVHDLDSTARDSPRSRQDLDSPPPSFSDPSSGPPEFTDIFFRTPAFIRGHRHSDEFDDDPLMPRMTTGVATPRSFRPDPMPPTPPDSSTTIVHSEVTVNFNPEPIRRPANAIVATTEFTIQEYHEDPPQTTDDTNTKTNTVAPDAIFGDQRYYQANIWSAASQFTRNLWNEPEVNNGQGGIETRTNRKGSITWLLAIINLLALVADSMLPVMIPALMYDFSVQGFQWLIAGPAIGAAATVLTVGNLYSVLSFKPVYCVSVGILMIATALHGSFAPNMVYLFAIRILLGVGIAGQQLGALFYLEGNGTFRNKARHDFFVGVSSGIGMALGPVLGGICGHRKKEWAWGYYTVSVILALVFVALLHQVPNNLRTNSQTQTFGSALTWKQLLNHVDTLGTLLSFFGIIVLFVALNFTGTYKPWNDGLLDVAIGIGALLVIIFVLQQVFKIFTSPSTQLLPTRSFKDFKTTMLFLLSFLTAAIFSIILPYTALYQLTTRAEPSPMATGFDLLAMTGPHLLFTLIIAVYIGSGIAAQHPVLPSYSAWSFLSTVFVLSGTALLFANVALPFARTFALAAIGFWSAVTPALAHHLMDLRPGPASNKRAFVLFAQFLGAAASAHRCVAGLPADRRRAPTGAVEGGVCTGISGHDGERVVSADGHGVRG